jgi:hypothetical protein
MNEKQAKELWNKGSYIGGINPDYVSFCVRKRYPIPALAVHICQLNWIECCGYLYNITGKKDRFYCTSENKSMVK